MCTTGGLLKVPHICRRQEETSSSFPADLLQPLHLLSGVEPKEVVHHIEPGESLEGAGGARLRRAQHAAGSAAGRGGVDHRGRQVGAGGWIRPAPVGGSMQEWHWHRQQGTGRRQAVIASSLTLAGRS